MNNGPHGKLYVGVTSFLPGRVWQHKHNLIKSFTKKYFLHLFVWCELHNTMLEAISREEQIKKGPVHKKIALLEMFNPQWHDLYDEILQWTATTIGFAVINNLTDYFFKFNYNENANFQKSATF